MMLRRDIRGNHFNDRAISKSNTEKILHAGSLAPSVGFSQPWEFVVIRKRSTKQAIVDNFERENNKAALLFEDQKHGQTQARRNFRNPDQYSGI